MTRRVLLVDDDIAEITAVKRALVRLGARAQLATCSADALAAIAAERPDLVVVASDCGNGEGLELARRLAADESLPDLALLLLGVPEGPAPARALPRPLDSGQLAEDLRALLDGPGAPTGAPGPAGPSAQEAEERHRAADALRARAEQLRRAGGEEGGRREGEAQARREGEAQARREGEAQARRDAEARREAEAEARPRREAEARSRRAEELDRHSRRLAEEDLGRALTASEAEEALRLLTQEVGAPIAEAAEDELRQRTLAARARRAPEPAPAREKAPVAPPRSAPPPTVPSPPAPSPAAHHPADAPVPPELASGTLAEISPARLLALASRARLGGRLDFGGSAARSLYFEDGRIVGATSAAPAERVEEVALRLGLVTRDQHRQAAPACAGLPSRRAALALLQRGFLKPEELTGLVRRRAEEVVFALFAEKGASFRHAAARPPPEERTALDRSPPSLAVEGVRRRWQEDRLGPVLGGPATLLGPAAGPPAADLALGAEAERLLELADGLRTLDEIALDSPLDPLSTRQVLAALVEVGALEVRIRAEAAAGAADAAVDLARLEEKLEQVRRADYFTILGLSRTATPYEIRASAERLLAGLDPDRWAGVSQPGLAERLAEVRRVVDEARQVLTDDELRAAYLQGLQ